MKITRENINSKWHEIEKYISENNKKVAESSYLEMARDWDSLTKEFTEEEKAETLQMMNDFIARINEQVEAGMKTEAATQKRSRDNRKKAAAKGRDHFATVRKNKKEAKAQKKNEAKVIKMNTDKTNKKDYTTSRANYTLSNMYENYVSMSYDEYVSEAKKDTRPTNDIHISKEVVFDSMDALRAMDRDSYEAIVTKTDAKNLKHIGLSDKMREQLEKQFGKDTKYCYFPFIGITTHAIALYVKSELKAVINCEGHNYGKYLLIPSDKTKKDTSKTYAWWNKNIDKVKVKMINDDCGNKFTPITNSSTSKSAKPKVAEAPNWLKTLRSFVNAAGKEKPVTSIRTQVLNIQDRFDAKRNLNTPYIEIIREIQDKLIPYANKKEKKVSLPQWESLVNKCKEIIASLSVSTKLDKDELKTSSLAGLGSVWKIDYKGHDKKGFKTLADAKAYLKNLSIETVKKMTKQHTFIYHEKNGDIDKVCNFNVSKGKINFKAVERY